METKILPEIGESVMGISRIAYYDYVDRIPGTVIAIDKNYFGGMDSDNSPQRETRVCVQSSDGMRVWFRPENIERDKNGRIDQ